MKKALIYILLFVFTLGFFGFNVNDAEARSGCCSYHGGVQSSGCGCNDGTPLSATCAPYYSCTSYSPTPVSIPAPKPSPDPVPITTGASLKSESEPLISSPISNTTPATAVKTEKQNWILRFFNWLFD